MRDPDYLVWIPAIAENDKGERYPAALLRGGFIVLSVLFLYIIPPFLCIYGIYGVIVISHFLKEGLREQSGGEDIFFILLGQNWFFVLFLYIVFLLIYSFLLGKASQRLAQNKLKSTSSLLILLFFVISFILSLILIGFSLARMIRL